LTSSRGSSFASNSGRHSGWCGSQDQTVTCSFAISVCGLADILVLNNSVDQDFVGEGRTTAGSVCICASRTWESPQQIHLIEQISGQMENKKEEKQDEIKTFQLELENPLC
jgi:hypothetical protein